MININYYWDEALAIKSAKELYDYEFKSSKKRFIGWFFIGLVQFGVVGALKHNAYGFLVLGTIGVVYWYSIRWPLREYFIKKTFHKSPLANTTINLIAKEDGIYKGEDLQISKDHIKDVVKLENGIVVYYMGGNLYFPNKAFKDSDDKKSCIKLYS